MFAPLRRLQRDLAVAGPGQHDPAVRRRTAPTPRLESALQLEDLGVRGRRQLDDPRAVVRRERERDRQRAARDRGAERRRQARPASRLPVFTYLANTIRKGDRQIPYSLVTATDLEPVAARRRFDARARARRLVRDADAIVLNEWAARELAATPGDRIDVDYYRLGSRQPGLVDPHRRVHARAASSRLPAWPPTAGSRPTIRASPARRAWPTGIRRSRSISPGCARRTNATGRTTGQRRRRSSRTSADAICGDALRRATSIRLAGS